MQSFFTVKQFVRNIELWFSAVGVIVILSAGWLAPPAVAFWKVAGITAILVGLIHGGIFWAVRRRQRKIREKQIAEIREMLADVVKNKLSVIDMYLPEEQEAIVEEEIDGIRGTIRQISRNVDSLSEETIQDWKTKYDGAIRRSTDLEPA